ncbi:LapB repeat-containing protein [Listeria swaminathanii]|uniref:LapB repeat-containing protein n=1 Tax=Listeria swaminathanii TaxID=2713501 RepID=A0ABU2IBS8_9LIST|nr:LapB repeat-containing protein [Listeria swaminathanii]MDT0016569.1 LapB repeat-containing protein [Listeria swaminathanii]MDT0022005.1 LapB repeat-containing protein [Listeria swaminathanii]MDT0032969.1 LapB repeat-containing protein [Listeria swaminathanii]MDT0051181.1 LapB repeat-containing protein [Listeria swaminathanii]MDT0053946.1 LapB repeat-containing protein [Listeria swaminathanii]
MTIKSKIMKIGICSVMVLVPLSQTALPSFAAEEVGEEVSSDIVNIPDSALRAQLNQIIGQPAAADITKSQLAGFRTLSLSAGITDFTGLEYATNLETLTLNSVNATNYTAIGQLKTLKTLWIQNSNVTSSSMPDLNGLTNLESLNLSNNKLDDSAYAKFNQLSSLTDLNLSGNKGLTSVSELQSLSNLTKLNLNNCQVSDFRGIENLSHLTSLTSTGAQFIPSEVLKIKSSTLKYDAKQQTMFVPFDIMTPSHITNYDGSEVNPAYKTMAYRLILNDEDIDYDRITGMPDGLSITGVTPAEFDQIETLTLWTTFDSKEVKTPPNLAGGTFNVSGSGMQDFTVDHSAIITAEENISYVAGGTVTPEKFLADIKADANGATVTSDVAEKVDFAKAGTYTVTLNATNSLGVQAEPVQVTVTIIEKTVITADPEITYNLNEAKTEAEFLAEIKAATNDETAITSDFATAVDFTKAGEYTVTLNAESDVQKADPLTVKVKVSEKAPDPEPTPDPETPSDEPVQSSDSVDDPSNNEVENAVESADSADSADPVVSISAQATTNTVKLPKTGDSLPATGVVVGFLVLGLGVMIAREK